MKFLHRSFFSLCLGIALTQTASASCRDISLQGSVDGDTLWTDFAILASPQMEGRKTGTSGSEKARNYIATRYQQLGLRSFEEDTPYLRPFSIEKAFGNIDGINVVGWYKGSKYPDSYIVITAHYDHLGIQGRKVFYGADDNASGVAAMLAIAEHVVKQGSQHSVIFLATDAEEKGLFGAKAFVDKPPVALADMRYNLNLDMLSQGGRKKALYVSGTRKEQALMDVIKAVKEDAGICLISGHRAPRSGSALPSRTNWRQASDHAAFGKKDIPYLFVGVSVHRYYHTPEDKVDKTDRTFYTGAVETSLALFKGMDGVSE